MCKDKVRESRTALYTSTHCVRESSINCLMWKRGVATSRMAHNRTHQHNTVLHIMKCVKISQHCKHKYERQLHDKHIQIQNANENRQLTKQMTRDFCNERQRQKHVNHISMNSTVCLQDDSQVTICTDTAPTFTYTENTTSLTDLYTARC